MIKGVKYIAAIMLLACFLSACKREEEQNAPNPIINQPTDTTGNDSGPTPYNLIIPFGFPVLVSPANNPLTVEGVELGKKLFHDKILSADNTISCASCHKQELSFVDGDQFSTGVGGKIGMRNSMALFNLGWAEMFNPTAHRFMWDGGNPDLENQVLVPIQNPIEMNQSLSVLEKKLRLHNEYPKLFKKSFGTDSITIKHVMFAIAQFERTLISAGSKYDKYKQGLTKLTAEELRGLEIFSRDDNGGGGCFHCHGNDRSPFFTNFRFHNNGLDVIPTDNGLGAITGNPEDNGRFKVPSLRNLAFTAPYMHDGRFKTLEEVIEFYNSGMKDGLLIDPLLKKHLPGLNLTEQDKKDLLSFLNTLNDYEFLIDKKFK